jgi:oligoendopeptidase F
MMLKRIPPRSEIAPEHTWNTASVFPSDQDWEGEIERVNEQLPSLLCFKGHLADDSKSLADWFEAAEPVLRSLAKIVLYASMGHTVDTTDQAAAAKNDRARSLAARVQSAIAFAEPEILAIGHARLRQWIKEEPRLAIYEHYFDQLERRKAHIRSAEIEELLGQLADPFRTAAAIHGILADADLKFSPAHDTPGEPVEIAQGNMGKLLNDPDREVRRTAWENYADAHIAVKNAMASCLAAGVKQNVFMARARRYGSALEAATSANHIPMEVFHNLIATYRRHLPTWHRYWRLRRRALGYEKLYVYDARAPLSQKQPHVPFEQAVEWITEGMQPLGKDYVDTLRRGVLKQRWVDIYPNQGKRAGAFSNGAPGTHPFILMSYNNDIFSLSTLAHELGHSMHSYYTWKTQPFIFARYSIFVAEVASNFNQAMVRTHLLKANKDRDF